MKLTAVLDASGIIGLAKGGVFQHLAALYEPLWVPSSVTQEVTSSGPVLAGATELLAGLGSWITERAVPGPLPALAAPLSTADREVLALALSAGVDHILSNDRVVCREAEARGLTCLRPPLVVVFLRQEGIIPAVRPVLDQMRQQGFGITDALYQQALAAVGE